MSLHLVTGYAGKEHVTSADQGSFNAATLGNGQFALERGRQFEAQVISNNKVRVYDGDLMMQGRHIRLNEKTYEELDFENGSQGMKRTDLIAVRYTKDAVTGIEDAKMVVIKGTPSAGSPQEPALTKGDIINDGVLINEFALYSVSFHDLTIQTPVKLFNTVSTWESMQRQAEEGVRQAIDDFEREAEKSLNDIQNEFTNMKNNLSTWVDGDTIVVENTKLKAVQPYINKPTATTSWKLSSHTKAGLYSFKIISGASGTPQDAPGWFTGRTDFCLEVVPFNGDGTNGKGIVLQRFSGKEYRNGITNIRESVRLVDVGAVESGTEPEEWTDLGVYKATMLATESVGRNPQSAVINLAFKSEEYSIAKGSTGLPTEDDYIVLTAGGETNSTGAQILVREKDGMVYTRGRHGGGWKTWNRTVRYEPFKATGGISGPQYIPIGFLKYSAPGSGYVYGGMFDLNVYGSMEGGGYGVSHLCISIVSHNGNLKMSGSVDNKMSNFDIIAVRGNDDTSYRLYIRTTYGGTSGEISLFSNAGNDVSLSIGAGSADSPAGLTEISLSNAIIYGNVEVISSIRDVKTLYAGTASVDGGAVTLTDIMSNYKTISFACFNGKDRHTGTLMCDTLETGVQYVVPVGSGYIKFSFAADQFTLISNTVGANLHRIYGKK